MRRNHSRAQITSRGMTTSPLACLLLLLAGQAVWAQGAPSSNPSDRVQELQEWFQRISQVTDQKLAEAERALEMTQRLKDQNPAISDPVASQIEDSWFEHASWPQAYLDVFRRLSAPYQGRLNAAVQPFRLEEAAGGLGSNWRQPNWSVKPTNTRQLQYLVLSILEREGLPRELLAVPLIESGFDLFAESPKGARGLWQLMPDTARRYGLNPDGPFDERLDPFRSTIAAARYLKDLYGLWGDWALALAAYNAGEGRVGRALAASPSRDFSTLASHGLLPQETRAYVPAVLAAARDIVKGKRSRNSDATSVAFTERGAR